MSHHKVRITVNGTTGEDEVESRMLLVHYLRETRGLTGTHVGCDTANCGACTVMVDGLTVKSCNVLAVAADGELSPVQEGFRQCHGLQCGYCTPGMVMAAIDLLRDTPEPSEEAIRQGLEGNLCRCTGYCNIVRAVRRGAQEMGQAVKSS